MIIPLYNLSKKLNVDNFFGTGSLRHDCKPVRTDFYTIPHLFPYNAFDEDRQLFLNENSVAFFLEISPLSGIQTSDISSLSNMFANLEEGVVVQSIQYASKRIEPFLGAQILGKENSSLICQKLIHQRTQFLNDSGTKPLFEDRIINRNFRNFICVSLEIQKSSDYKKIAKYLTKSRNHFESSLNTLGASCKTLDATDLILFTKEIFNYGLDNKHITCNFNGIDSISKQISNGSQSIKTCDDHLKLNNKFYAQIMTVSQNPKSWSQNMNSNLIGDLFASTKNIDFPFISSFSFKIVAQENAKVKSFKAMRKAKSLAKSKIAEFMPNSKQKAIDATFLYDKLQDGSKLIQTTHHLCTFTDNEDSFEHSTRKIQSLYENNGFKLAVEQEMQLCNFLQCLPMIPGNLLMDDFIALGKTKKQISWTASNLMPLIGEYKGNCMGQGMLLTGRRGQLFNWSPFFNEEGNYNLSVVGKSGSGKSFLMQELMARFVSDGCKTFIIDDGYSFEQTAQILGGDFIEFSPDSQNSINPFSMIDNDKFMSNAEYKGSMEAFLVNIVSQMARNESICSEEEKKDLEKSISHILLAKKNQATIDDLIDDLESQNSSRTKDLAHLLYSFSGKGMYGSYFTGSVGIDVNQNLLCFELSKVKTQPHLQKVIMLTVMFLISESVYRAGEDVKDNTAIFIDEAWDLMSGGEIAIFIEKLVRRIRKYKGSLIVGTQSVNDFYKNEAAKACFENSDWRIFMAQKSESIDTLKKESKLSISPFEEKILKSLTKTNNFSELAISGPNTFAIGRLMCDPFSAMLYSSKKEHRERKQKLVQSGMSVIEAIEQARQEFF